MPLDASSLVRAVTELTAPDKPVAFAWEIEDWCNARGIDYGADETPRNTHFWNADLEEASGRHRLQNAAPTAPPVNRCRASDRGSAGQ